MHVYAGDHVGYTWGEDCLVWAPGGRRLAATIHVSGFVVIDEGRAVYEVDLEVTQDHPADACWIDDRQLAIRTDAGGAVVEVIPGVHLMSDGPAEPIVDVARDSQQPVDPSTASWVRSNRMPGDPIWNAAIGALVGESFIDDDPSQMLCGIDPKSGEARYITSLAQLLPNPKARRISASPDGRRIAVAGFAGVTLFDGDTGRERTRLPRLLDEPGVLEHEQGHVDGMRWGAGNRLAVWVRGAKPRMMFVAGDRVAGTVDELCAACAWSPGGDAVAVLSLDHGTLRILDVPTLQTRSITTGIRSVGFPAVLGWGAADHLVLVTPCTVAFWTRDGKLLARHELG